MFLKTTLIAMLLAATAAGASAADTTSPQPVLTTKDSAVPAQPIVKDLRISIPGLF